MKRATLLVWLMTAALCAAAQVPVGKAPAGPVLLKGGTIHTGTGEVLENGYLALADGKITHVAPAGAAPSGDFEVIELNGAHVYPGLILPSVDLGLGEVDALRASLDDAEHGRVNPNVRALIAYNTDSELIPTLRFNGITLAQTTPNGGLISGTSSVMALDGWNWEDAAYAADDGVHFRWPVRMRNYYDWSEGVRKREENKRYAGDIATLTKLFEDAAVYGATAEHAHTNLKLEAVQGLLDGRQTAYVHADVATAMMDGVLTLKSLGVKRLVIVGARDALEIADFLVEQKVPVILSNLHRVPRTARTDVNRPYKLPGLLKAAGVDFCLGYGDRANGRNLAFVAGTAAAWGLSKEDALAAVTSDTARILGLDDRTGSLAVGKDANLFVSKGDALDMRTNQLTLLYIRGREVPLQGMQQRLYERYRAKYSE